MKSLKIFHDNIGKTLNIWFDDPKKEYVSEEIGEDTILVKDKSGKIIGLEKLNYSVEMEKSNQKLPVEIISA